MAVPIEMPKLGNTVEECVLARWNKREGDRVSAGDIVAEIETDKATFEVAAPAAGIVLCTFFKEGDLVPVFSNICVIGEAGEDIERFRPCAPAKSAPVPAAPCQASMHPAPHASAAQREAFLSPRARRFAAGEPVFLTLTARHRGERRQWAITAGWLAVTFTRCPSSRSRSATVSIMAVPMPMP